ncbi:hypothetical protein PFLmoz3_02733 [Pseudomonas fluorescens]|uniref:Uncharacterized protein n=1 Tax=Pseudomonas fluorescens TaxID=294 RepID=A0A109LGW8_PSEFL|nr:hypothetical protein PFLmoz3_02733 [Pseudomonas fluorescens]
MGTQGKLVLAGACVWLDHPFELRVVQALAAFDAADQATGLGALAGETHLAVLDVQLVEPGVGGQAVGQVIQQRGQGRLRPFTLAEVLRRATGVEQLLAQGVHLGDLGFLLLDSGVHAVEYPLAVVEPQQHRRDQQRAAQPRQAALQLLAGRPRTRA